MARKEILLWPDDRLTKPSEPISVFDSSVLELAADLRDTCVANGGAGLAAVQIGVFRQAYVVLVGSELVFMANPVWVGEGPTEVVTEGCLSFPGVSERTARYLAVRVRYQTATGEIVENDLYGLAAQAVQHESEHLEGHVLPDRLGSLQRSRFLTRYKLSRRRVKKDSVGL